MPVTDGNEANIHFLLLATIDLSYTFVINLIALFNQSFGCLRFRCDNKRNRTETLIDRTINECKQIMASFKWNMNTGCS